MPPLTRTREVEDPLDAEDDLQPRRDQEEDGGMEGAAHDHADEVGGHGREIYALPSPGPLPRRGEGRVGAATQIFQELIQSRSLEPAGFIAVLVETTSTGLMVTKS